MKEQPYFKKFILSFSKRKKCEDTFAAETKFSVVKTTVFEESIKNSKVFKEEQFGLISDATYKIIK